MALIFFDLDNTTLINGAPAPGVVESIKKLKENNHTVVIATGRSPKLLYGKDKLLGIDHLVLANGSYVLFDQQVIFEKYIPNHIVKRLMDYVDDIKTDLVIEYFDRYVAYRKDTEIPDWFSDLFDIEYPVYDPTFYPDEHVFCMVVFNNDKVKDLMAAFPELEFNLSNQAGYDVNIKGELKAEGVEAVVNHLNYPWEETYAFGDGHNDITMLKIVKHGIAMGNANQEVKDAADYVTSDVKDYGVEKALKHFKLI